MIRGRRKRLCVPALVYYLGIGLDLLCVQTPAGVGAVRCMRRERLSRSGLRALSTDNGCDHDRFRRISSSVRRFLFGRSLMGFVSLLERRPLVGREY